MAESSKYGLLTESYVKLKRSWPREGQHILAQFDQNSIVVYQAFNPKIAEYAVKNQKFGGDHYSFNRMSWIKTNFLWMMYRCGWASKKNQERVLAIWLMREGFEEILTNAYTAKLQKSKGMSKDDIEVRLQWDPDHTPTYNKVTRRAIQLGLKGNMLKKFSNEWILNIEDITDFVKAQHETLQKQGEESIVTPLEHVYSLRNESIATRIGLDFIEESQGYACEVNSVPTETATYSPKAATSEESFQIHETNLIHPLQQLKRREEKLQKQLNLHKKYDLEI